MVGTKAGAEKWKKHVENKYGNVSEYMATLGRKGGQVPHPRPFQTHEGLAARAGAIGGHRSRRGCKYLGLDKNGEPMFEKKEVKNEE